MFGGADRSRPVVIIAGLFGAVGATVFLGLQPTPSASEAGQVGTPIATHRMARVPVAPVPTCRLTPGDSVAFRVESALSAGDIEDRFEATLSWMVVHSNADQARVRAAFSQVTHTQQLAQAGEETTSPAGVAFYLDVAADCSVRNTAYAPEWNARTRVLVQTQIDNLAFALPTSPASTWRVPGSDGVGAYTAQYRVTGRAPWTIERTKTAHAPRGDAASLGIDLRVEKAEGSATFEAADPRWWQSARGHETMVIDAEGSPLVTLQQRFSIERDDALFESVPALAFARADRQDPHQMPLASAVPTTQFKSYPQAWDAFAQAVQEGRDHDAAQEMAAWLRAHPEDVARLVTRLHAAEDPTQTAALFLALELSGTDEARGGLMGLVDAEALSALDQARAASALADLGQPTQRVAEHLLKRAEVDDMAARVSLLGVGAMARRSEDATLREGVVSALSERLDSADTGMVNTVIDAMGNSGDAAFADALGDALSADSKMTRRHAAEALARLPAEEAAPRLLEQLEVEESARVAAVLVNALDATGQRGPAAVDVMQSRLARADAEERAAVIDWLGKGGDDASQRILVAQFHREPSARIKQRIGRYVPATALR